MSLRRTWAVQLPRAAGVAASGALLLGLGGVLACSAYPTLKDVPVDCTVESGYDFLYLGQDDAEGGPSNWWASGDNTPSARARSTIQAIANGGRCGSKTSDVLYSSDYNDWGSLFGLNSFSVTNASGYQGLSFWSRAPGNTTKGFTIALEDANTSADAAGSHCVPVADGGVQGGGPAGPIYDPNTGTIISSGSSSAAPLPNQCGNDYSIMMAVTSEWGFYTIPFGEFQQAATPNRVPNSLLQKGNVHGTGLLIDQLAHLIIRMPREAETELWIDNLAYYSKKGQTSGRDAGVGADAAQM